MGKEEFIITADQRLNEKELDIESVYFGFILHLIHTDEWTGLDSGQTPDRSGQLSCRCSET